MDVFDFEKISDVAQSLGISCKPGFHLVLLVEMPKGKAEKSLPQLVPGIDDMAVMVTWHCMLIMFLCNRFWIISSAFKFRISVF